MANFFAKVLAAQRPEDLVHAQGIFDSTSVVFMAAKN
jgi:hypothetical protein